MERVAHWRAICLALLIGWLLAGCSLLPDPVATRPSAAPATAAARPSAKPTARATTRPTARATARPPAKATPTPAARPSTRPAATARPVATPRPAPAITPIAGFDAVAASELPPEARDTLALIERGGPFPYRQDGAVFQNRERRLPRKPAGYYHEYTVETPGSDDRGARRIIAGGAGELFYTADHYDTFVQVIPE